MSRSKAPTSPAPSSSPTASEADKRRRGFADWTARPASPRETLFGHGGTATTTPTRLPVARLVVRPDQPRRFFDEADLDTLTASIRDKGVLAPLLVRPLGAPASGAAQRYEIVAGERRFRAAKAAGLMEVPVHVVEVDDKEAAQLALIDNLQRVDLNPVDLAHAIVALLARELGQTSEEVRHLLAQARPERAAWGNVAPEVRETVEQVFSRFGRGLTPQGFRRHHLPLLNLPEDLQEAVSQGLEYTKAQALVSLEDAEARAVWIVRCREDGLSLTALRKGMDAKTDLVDGGDEAEEELPIQRLREIAQRTVRWKELRPAERRRVIGLIDRLECILL